MEGGMEITNSCLLPLSVYDVSDLIESHHLSVF